MKTISRLAACMLGLAAALPVHAQEKVVLKVAHFLPAVSAAHSKMIVPWCEKIQKESNGGLECQLYPAMQLGGNPSQLFGQARDGIADIVWTLPGYTPGRFPITEVFELPFFAGNYEPTSRALWDFTQQHAQKEFRGVKPLATWVNGPYHLHLRDKGVQKLEDLRGMKVRAPSRLGNDVLQKLGATAMGMPLPQTAESFSKGVIDGALLPWEVVPAVKLQEMAASHTEITGDKALLVSTMIFVMNERKYKSLPDNLKKVIDDNSGSDLSAWFAARFEEADKVGRDLAVQRGNKIYQLPEEEVQRWKDATASVTKTWVEDTSKNGVDGQTLLNDAQALVAKHSK